METEKTISEHTKVMKLISKDEIKEMILFFDGEFEPPLSQRVDMEEYISKLEKFGNVFVLDYKNESAGIIAFYANDYATKCAYYNILAISKNFQNKGLGSLLFKFGLDKIEKSEMEFVRLRVRKTLENLINFYNRCGFKYECDANEESIYMIKKIIKKL